jgi:endonuclease YncB( thermonuclease family)
MRRRMAAWAGRPRRAGDVRSRLVLLVILLACVIAAGAYNHWKPRLRLAPTVGSAYVIDGDTIDIGATRIRLEAIDAPELEQSCNDAQARPWPCGRRAAEELRHYVNGQALTCEPTRFDRYRRVLATCFRPDGSNVSAWLVRQGWAVAFRSTTRYRAEQEEAAAAKRGIWAGTFTLPWEWREREAQRRGAGF